MKPCNLWPSELPTRLVVQHKGNMGMSKRTPRSPVGTSSEFGSESNSRNRPKTTSTTLRGLDDPSCAWLPKECPCPNSLKGELLAKLGWREGEALNLSWVQLKQFLPHAYCSGLSSNPSTKRLAALLHYHQGPCIAETTSTLQTDVP